MYVLSLNAFDRKIDICLSLYLPYSRVFLRALWHHTGERNNFQLRDSEYYIWCGHPVCDRMHIAFDCPKFEHPRQQLLNEASLNSPPSSSQSRDLLFVSNKSHLA